MPEFTVSNYELHESNPCHTPAGSPAGGQFCSGVTRAGITSARPVGAPDYRGNAEVFRQMQELRAQLRALPGVSRVIVQPGLGAWHGGREPTWIVGYRGNGEARRLLARTGQRYNQDAVLLMYGCRGADCDPAVELHFARPVGSRAMDAIGQVLGAEGLGGWTWGKRAGKTVLRMVSIPAWGGERAKHLETTRRISAQLQSRGWTHRMRVKNVRTEVLERGTYAQAA